MFTHRVVLGAAVVLVLAAVGGVSYGSIPDSGTGVITGCYITTGTNAGRLRVIDAQAGATCLATETSLTWNSRGPRFRGAWSTKIAYQVDDLVTNRGSAYIALVGSTGVPCRTPPTGPFSPRGAPPAPRDRSVRGDRATQTRR
jgi:hypothetical protein